MRMRSLCQKFYAKDGQTYYWREAIDYGPPRDAVFEPLFDNRGYYALRRS